MSVSFDVSVSEEDIVSHNIHCFATEYGDTPEDGHGHRSFNTWEECKEAYLAGVSVGTVSRDCCTTTKGFVFDSSHVAINMSNSNAMEMFTMLGFVVEGEELPWCGRATTDDLRGRILIARAIGSDCGQPGYTERGANGAQLIDGGRRPGYFAERYTQLEALCDFADEYGKDISWS